MRAATLLPATLCLLGLGTSDARPPEIQPAAERATDISTVSASAADFRGDRSDTLWFGGDDGTCVAIEGGVWDWNIGDPLQKPTVQVDARSLNAQRVQPFCVIGLFDPSGLSGQCLPLLRDRKKLPRL